jgi:cytochrome o ubiquinol oxidase subunit IV
MSNPDYDPSAFETQFEHREDHAPGDEPEESAGHWVLNSNLGLLFSVILTAAAFWIRTEHLVWGPAVSDALIVLAIAQMGVHLVFFLHVTTGPDNTNNVLALAFGILVVFLVVLGSMWIMDNMNQNMMPTPNPQMDMAPP